MSKVAIYLKPGILRILRWFVGFDPTNYKVTTSQVWIRLHEIPLEHREEQNILNIAGGVRLPLKIDPLMISLYQGLYAQVFVDIDFTQPLPERYPRENGRP